MTKRCLKCGIIITDEGQIGFTYQANYHSDYWCKKCASILKLTKEPSAYIAISGEKISQKPIKPKPQNTDEPIEIKPQNIPQKLNTDILENKTAKEIVELVKEKTNIQITLSLKSKQSIINRAKELLNKI